MKHTDVYKYYSCDKPPALVCSKECGYSKEKQDLHVVVSGILFFYSFITFIYLFIEKKEQTTQNQGNYQPKGYVNNQLKKLFNQVILRKTFYIYLSI